MFRHLKCHPQGAHCALLKLRTSILVLVKSFITLYNQHFIEVYHFVF